MRMNVIIKDRAVKQRIAGVQSKLDNLSIPLLKAKDYVLKETDKQFTTKGSNLGTPWKSRTKSYSWPILDKTGKMRKGFRFKPTSPKDRITIYNIIDYFKYHQSARARQKLPRRQMLVVNNQIKKGVKKVFQNYLKTALR